MEEKEDGAEQKRNSKIKKEVINNLFFNYQMRLFILEV
jgi:hypothetical protein